MVLTCRTGQYQALERSRESMRDAAQIHIRPVGLPKARTFLVRRVVDEGRWQPVLAGMKRTGNRPLARALSTPWRLTLTAIVYDKRDPNTGTYLRDPAELISPALDTEDKIRDHLLGLLIPTLTTVHHGPHPPHYVHRWLKTLACYLNSNTTSATCPGRRVAGRELSETDLILHELWPLAGNRLPRVIPALVPVIGWTVFVVYMLTYVPVGRSPQPIIVASVIISTLASIYWRCRTPWPSPSKFDLQQILTRAGQRQLLGGLPVGLAVGLAMGLAFGPAVGLTIGCAFGFAFGLTDGLTGLDYSPVGPHEAVRSSITAGLAIGLTFGLPIGLAVGLKAGLPFGPLAQLTAGLAFGLTVGLTFGPLAGLADGLTAGLMIALSDALTDGLTAGLMVGLAAGIMVGSRSGLVGWRYLALLPCTRRWNNQHLPWRLGEFLRWCYDAGLVRIAGTGYQFRHRELQEYLIHNPPP